MELSTGKAADDASNLLLKKVLRLRPSEFKLVRVRDVLPPPHLPDLGGVRFKYQAVKGEILPGHVIGRGILIAQQQGFASPLMLHESLGAIPTNSRAELHAPAAYFGHFAVSFLTQQRFTTRTCSYAMWRSAQ